MGFNCHAGAQGDNILISARRAHLIERDSADLAQTFEGLGFAIPEPSEWHDSKHARTNHVWGKHHTTHCEAGSLGLLLRSRLDTELVSNSIRAAFAFLNAHASQVLPCHERLHKRS